MPPSDTDPTAAFAAYLAPARARPQIWRLALGLAFAAAVYAGSVMVLLGTIWTVLGPAEARRRLAGLVEAGDPVGTLLLFASFAGMALGAMAAAGLLHRRRPGTLFGPRRRVQRHFGIAIAAAAAIYAPSLLAWSLAFDAVPNLGIGLWITLLPLALIGLATQTLAEELLFRAYLLQQLAARFRSPAIWLVLPALVFGAVHYDPSRAGDNAWLVVGAASAFGLVAADLTARTGCIGAAWGLHFANNFIAVLILATAGTLEGLALFVTPYAADDTATLRLLMLGDLAVLVLIWLVLRRVLCRRPR